MNKFKGIIFDMDGVLVNSEPVIEKAAIRGLKEYGVEAVGEDFQPFIGCGEERYIAGVAEKYGVSYQPEMKTRVYDIYLEIVREVLENFVGVPELLHDLKAAGLRLALASSADMIKIQANMKAVGVPLGLFDVVLGGESVSNKKPAPDIYLLALEKLGLSANDCVVVEDAVNGVQAARAAGMECIAVSTSFSKEDLAAAGATETCDEVTGITKYLK